MPSNSVNGVVLSDQKSIKAPSACLHYRYVLSYDCYKKNVVLGLGIHSDGKNVHHIPFQDKNREMENISSDF